MQAKAPKLLKSRRLKSKTIEHGGVGNTQIEVGDEWACLLDLLDGNNQSLAVEKSTSELPIANLAEVKEMIKKRMYMSLVSKILVAEDFEILESNGCSFQNLEQIFTVKYCQAQPKPQLSWAELALFS